MLLVWISAALLLCSALAAVGVWMVHRRLFDLGRAAAHLEGLDELRAAVARLAADRSDLDLRRVEHVLIEVRDLLRRQEDALLRMAQVHSGGASAPAAGGGGLSERVTTRLFALGYERVQVLDGLAELERIGDGDGEVRVEAKRGGVPCKGRVLVRGGLISDVEMQSAYATFP